jgi:alcohol dehydrogenase
VQALTAWYGLVDRGALAAGDVLLLHSAAGGVGLHALAIARARNASVVATVGREDKRALLTGRGLEPELVIVRDRRAFGRQLDSALHTLDATGLDVVFDAILGPFFLPAWTRLRPEGRYLLYGAADFMPAGTRANYLRLGLRYLRRPHVDPLAMIASNRSLLAFNLIWLWDALDRLPAVYAALEPLRPEPPLVGRRFGFGDVPAAIRYLQSGASVGKVVVEP